MGPVSDAFSVFLTRSLYPTLCIFDIAVLIQPSYQLLRELQIASHQRIEVEVD